MLVPSYAYRAVHSSGRITRGAMTAANENELSFTLNQSGLELIDAHEQKPTAPLFTLFRQKLPPRALAAFCSRLHDLLEAHVPLPDALKTLHTTATNRALTDALAQMIPAIASGKNVADAFALFPELFSPLFIALVRAGEQAGKLTTTFLFLAQYTERRAHDKERLIHALRYPLFLFIVAGGAVGFMTSLVIPQITLFLESLNSTLPTSTRLLVTLSTGLSTYALPLLGLLGFSAFGVFIAQRTSPRFGITFDRVLLHLPVLGLILLKTDLARAMHSLTLLLESGCPIVPSVRQASEVLSNRALKESFALAQQRLIDGAALSQALEGLFPPFAINMLRTGEQTGNVIKCMHDIVTTYERETSASIDAFVSMLEPALTLIIGGLLAWTVLAVLGPLYGNLSVLGGGV